MNAAQRHERLTHLPIGTRVRLRGTANIGTIFAVPYRFLGELRAGVRLDSDPLWHASIPVSELIAVKAEPPTVPPEARPVSVGVLHSSPGNSRQFANEARRNGDGTVRMVRVMRPWPEPWTPSVPPDARPLNFGALSHPAREVG